MLENINIWKTNYIICIEIKMKPPFQVQGHG
jgi:hypothetical protein